ncbi:MAG TPA: hypothetical protein DEA96_09120 [Leptospiraceae bacterium]|nr:hypothetical protein [Spirochaetaceae bacterium]HBS05113.1 hypothetical protein [Leptospiraceae bacterium]
MKERIKAYESLAVVRRCTVCMLLIMFVPLASCATYWQNRLKDSGDLVSAGYQDESYGLSLRAGPAKLGLHYKSEEGSDLGYRQGYVDRFQSQSFVALVLGSDILQGPLPGQDDANNSPLSDRNSRESSQAETENGTESREASGPGTGKETESGNANLNNEQTQADLEKLKNMSLEDIKKLPAFQKLNPEQQAKFIKQFQKMKENSELRPDESAVSPMTKGPPSEMEIRKKTYHARSPLGTSVPFKEKNPLLKSKDRKPVSQGFAPGSYLSSIEIKAGAYVGVYVAIHLGEFIDLFAGFVGLDPMKDDGPFEMGLSNAELEGLTEAEKELFRSLGPEQRKQFLNLSPEERRMLLERMNQQ